VGHCRSSFQGISPEFTPALIALDRTYYIPGQSQRVSSSTWTSWIAEGDHLRSASPPYAPLIPFVVDNIRSVLKTPILSPLAMIINVFYNLNQFMRDHGSTASDRLQTLVQLMSNLVTAIFFVPPGYGRFKNDPQCSQIPQHAHSMTGIVPSQVALALEQFQAQLASPYPPMADPELHDAPDTVDFLEASITVPVPELFARLGTVMFWLGTIIL